MSKHQILFELLKTLKIPVAYDHFEANKDIKPPFMAYREIDTDTFKADGYTYFRGYNFEIELITEIKNPSLQASLEELLTTNKIPYDISDEIWDEDEKIYHNKYTIALY